VNTARTTVENASEERNKVFADINSLCTRIVSELSASGASAETLAAAYAMVRKIKGQSASPRPAVQSPATEAQAASPTPAPTAARPRTNGRDFGTVANSFEKLVQTAMTEPLYQPEIPDLQVPALEDKLNALQNGIAAVSAAKATLSQARRERNAILYSGNSSLLNIAKAVKQSVKATFGPHSAEARAVNHVKFFNPKVK
jgi:hypothetical protein